MGRKAAGSDRGLLGLLADSRFRDYLDDVDPWRGGYLKMVTAATAAYKDVDGPAQQSQALPEPTP
jgi:hypothetical protein